MQTTDVVPKLRFPGFYEMPIFVQMNKIFPSIRNGFVGTATPYYTDNGIKYLQGKNIKNNKIDPSGMIFISKEFHEKQKKSILRLGDIVMVQSGHVGECACITKDYEGSNCHALLVLSSDKGIHSMYYTYYFYTEYGKKNIYKITTGNTIKHILSSDLKILDVPYVNIKEQQKIALFLSSVDKKISQLEKKKTLLETYKRGIMQKIFSQELRFKDDNGKEFLEWKEDSLGNIFDHRKGTGLSGKELVKDGEYPCILYGALYTKYDEVIKSVVEFSNIPGKVKSISGDLLVPASTTTSGIDLANFTALNQDGVSLGGDITIMRNKNEGDNSFWAHYLTHFHKKGIAKYAQGTTIVHLYYSHFKHLVVRYPCFKEQQKIASFLSSIDKKIEITSTQLEKTREFKKGLLQQMFV